MHQSESSASLAAGEGDHAPPESDTQWQQVRADESLKADDLHGKLDSCCVGEPAALCRCHVAEVDEPRAAPAAWVDQGKPDDQKIEKDKTSSKKRQIRRREGEHLWDPVDGRIQRRERTGQEQGP